MSQHPKFNSRLPGMSACGAVVVLLLIVLSPGAAQSLVGGAGSGGMGQSGPPREVNLGSLPQASPQPTSQITQHYRPLDGLTDAQYAARKAAARGEGIPGTPGTAVPAA